MADDAVELEAALRLAVAKRVGEARSNVWFGEATRIGLDADTLELGVPNTFFRDWIQRHYADGLLEVAQSITGRPLRLSFKIDAEAHPAVDGIVQPPDAQITLSQKKHLEPGCSRVRLVSSTVLQAQYPSFQRLEDFVAGPGNQLAYAAALEMAQKAGSTFNPLLLYSGVGLGKTHLLRGIHTALRIHHPTLVALYLTAEAFTNAFLDAMRAGSLAGFRNRHRKVGALLLDDAQFLAAKRATQDEFLHTFNNLLSIGAPVVLATDQHPRRIAGLNEELVSRFLGGLTVKLEAPDLVTRRAILSAKAKLRDVELPDPVLDFIGGALRSSVRELEGALCTVISHARLTEKKIDLDLAKVVLRDTMRQTSQTLVLQDVEQAVCELFDVGPDTLKSEGRSRVVVYPRMLAMFLARKHTGAAYADIGRYFGGRNHSTVIAAEKKVNTWLRDEAQSKLLAGFETVADALHMLERMLGR
jgi:chromosomal replication initiator protein